MAFASSFDPALTIVVAVAATLFLASLLCLLASLAMRWSRLREEVRSRDVEAHWRPICFAAMVGEIPESLPALDDRDLPAFIMTWIDTAERIRGSQAVEGLVELGQRMRISSRLHPWLSSRQTDQRLLALLALGLLRDRSALESVRHNLDESYPLLSLAAAKALMEIDPIEALPELLCRLDTPGWPQGRMRQLLELAPREQLSEALDYALPAAHAGAIPSLLRIVNALLNQRLDDDARAAMARFPGNEAVMSTMLELTTNPAELALARMACRHADPAVRRAGLIAISRIGGPDDIPLLRAMLEGDTWKNQQAAARVLIAMPVMDKPRAATIATSIANEQARQHWLEAMYLKGWHETPAEADAHA